MALRSNIPSGAEGGVRLRLRFADAAGGVAGERLRLRFADAAGGVAGERLLRFADAGDRLPCDRQAQGGAEGLPGSIELASSAYASAGTVKGNMWWARR